MNVNIDFTKNNIKVGYINENISTTLDIAIPDEMVSGSYKYRVVFQVHRFEQYKSDYVELDDNNHIIYEIPNTVTIKPTMDMQVVAYDENNGMVRKSKTITLVFDKSVIGRDFIVDPFRNQVKVAELKWDEYNKTNMSSKKLIEYVKQGFFITVDDNIIEVSNINEEDNSITFYHLYIENGELSGITFLTVTDNIISIENKSIDFSATIDSIEYDDEHSLHWKLDSIDEEITNGAQEIATLILDVSNHTQSINSLTQKQSDIEDEVDLNTQARHTHSNKSNLDKISESSSGNFQYNGEEYYNATDIEQAIANAEGDLVEIASNKSGWSSRYTCTELSSFGNASKGFSFLGNPVVSWRTNASNNHFYFQYFKIGTNNIPRYVTAYVDSYKNVISVDENDQYPLFKVNNKAGTGTGEITLYPEDILANNPSWEPTNDRQVATKYYVDNKIKDTEIFVELRDKTSTTAKSLYTPTELSVMIDENKSFLYEGQPLLSCYFSSGLFYFSTISIDGSNNYIGYRANNIINPSKSITLQTPRYIPATINNKTATNGNVTLNAGDISATSGWTPTNDTDLATKKYVDDSMKLVIQTDANGYYFEV